MIRRTWFGAGWLIVVVQVAAGVPLAIAQAPETSGVGWTDTAELSLLVTGGNGEASSLGFHNELRRVGPNTVFSLDAGFLRAESSTITRSAVGSPTDFRVSRDTLRVLTAENYHLRGRYEWDLNARTFLYVGGGWERNTFAGIANRYPGSGGVGTTWMDDDRRTLKTSYGLTVTRQDNVAGDDETFGGVRFGYDFREGLSPSTVFTSVLSADENLADTGDIRVDILNTVSVSMTTRLALKVSWQVLYDAQPSLGAVPLMDTAGVLTGETVLVELEKVDNFLTFALAATF